jgi:hypothetical protein
MLEHLENRLAPAVFNVAADDVYGPNGLVAAINTANSNGDSNNTINLKKSTYDLTTINNFWYGPNGLPAISSNLTIHGKGATIERDSAAMPFRLFYVYGGVRLVRQQQRAGGFVGGGQRVQRPSVGQLGDSGRHA